MYAQQLTVDEHEVETLLLPLVSRYQFHVLHAQVEAEARHRRLIVVRRDVSEESEILHQTARLALRSVTGTDAAPLTRL